MAKMTEAEFDSAATRWLGKNSEELADAERRVLKHAIARTPVARDLSITPADELTFGERLADRVAEFGGSWPFIILFGVFLLIWIGGNIALVNRALDPYPFIFLNLMLSMLAALQAPVIMMSQNRQSRKDHMAAAHDYEVNLTAEIEIMALHEKLDHMRAEKISALLAAQEQQISLLKQLLAEKNAKDAG